MFPAQHGDVCSPYLIIETGPAFPRRMCWTVSGTELEAPYPDDWVSVPFWLQSSMYERDQLTMKSALNIRDLSSWFLSLVSIYLLQNRNCAAMKATVPTESRT